MDVLIVISSLLVYGYSTYLAFTVTEDIKLYFLCEGVLVSLVLFGRYLEIVARGETDEGCQKGRRRAKKNPKPLENLGVLGLAEKEGFGTLRSECRRAGIRQVSTGHLHLGGSNPSHSATFLFCAFVEQAHFGEMSERFKEPVLKTGDGATHRGFKSHSLRQHTLEVYTQSISHHINIESSYTHFGLDNTLTSLLLPSNSPRKKSRSRSAPFYVLPFYCSLHSTDGWLVGPDRADRRSRTARRLTPSR